MRARIENILELAGRQGLITPAEVRALGLVPENLNKLAKKRKLVRVGRGLYCHPEFPNTERHSFVEVSKVVPEGVVCLLSALNLYDIGTQMPWEIWVAIPRGNRIPKTRRTRFRAVTMMNDNYRLGIVEFFFEGVSVRAYSLEKTIIDCFRLRRLVGHDVGVEALREAISKGKINPSELLALANKLRARRLIEPYLEAML